MHWRSSERRRKREDEAEAPVLANERPDASLVRLQIQREIVEAVLALEEPYRRTIVLRFVDDLSAREIADQLGIPASTVRSQVRRGLRRLRDGLDQAQGPRRWRAALMFPFVTPPASVDLFALTTGSTMKIGLVFSSMVTLIAATAVFFTDILTSSATPTELFSQAKIISEPPKAVPKATIGSPELVSPRRFGTADDRDQLSRAIASVRGTVKHQQMSFDFSGIIVGDKSTAPVRKLTGKLDKHYIRSRIAEIVPLVAECHSLAITPERALTGQLTVDFVVEGEYGVGGYVQNATIADDSPLQDQALSECVIETILSLRFAPPVGGGSVRVRYPFVFGASVG